MIFYLNDDNRDYSNNDNFYSSGSRLLWNDFKRSRKAIWRYRVLYSFVHYFLKRYSHWLFNRITREKTCNCFRNITWLNFNVYASIPKRNNLSLLYKVWNGSKCNTAVSEPANPRLLKN